MNTTRHQGRVYALQILYQFELSQLGKESEFALDSQELIGLLHRHYEHFQIPADLREFVGGLVAGVLFKARTDIDPWIEKNAQNWKITRMPLIDRAILRLGLYELLFEKGTPPQVVIDEAVELSKEFGTAESYSFVNGVLDAAFRSTN